MNPNGLTKHIHDLLIACEHDLKQQGSDKIAVRRTRAALQAAFYTSQHHFPILNQTPVTGPQNASKAGCICPAGASDSGCPVHGS